MKRASEKIKDFVEPQPFEAVQNFTADPARAHAAYRFTDATSDLLARWIDALADVPRPPVKGGAARALAGMRGVGKSHTLTVFGALAAQPQLRAKITDGHIATSARRLMDRRYMVVRVERGTRPTLTEEIADGLKDALGSDMTGVSDDPQAMLAIAASRTHDATLLVIVDTAFDRAARVERNDGKILSELAEAARLSNCFVALALDDDIAGAEGVNAALVSTYQIDYLDPEHLFRVADQFVLRKTATARTGLHEIYMHLRAVVPGFNWSEPRFAALYPVHPIITDLASAVRLYAPAFAFLPFAAEAATRASGRPALSLVLLDEVFDRTEHEMRRAEDLRETFAAFDELAAAGAAQFPIMQRLEVKLTLKALFILSLDGRGATPAEICAAMLFYDERNPSAPIERIAQMLARIVEISPNSLHRTEENGEIRWRFNITSSSAFEAALNESVERLRTAGEFNFDSLLHEAARARFPDWPFIKAANEASDEPPAGAQTPERDAAINFYVQWRGTNRLGSLYSVSPRFDTTEAHTDESPSSSQVPNNLHYDWAIKVVAPRVASASANEDSSNLLENENDFSSPPLKLIWHPANLTDDEEKNLLRLIALHTDAQLIADYGESARVTLSSLTAQAQRIWTRIYLDEGRFDWRGEGEESTSLEWTEEARGKNDLMSALNLLLAPLFDRHFSEHPLFTETLGEAETAQLIGDFFGGSNLNNADVQHLARTFAVPLGLAIVRGEMCMPDAGDATLKRAWVRETLALTDEADGETVPLETIHQTLRSTPFGLTRESAQLVLSSLVAGRRLELVTTEGDRISRRTLGRLLNWETIAGAARAATILQSAEELTAWARLIIGDETIKGSIADDETRELVRSRLAGWLDDWHERRLLESFEQLPDAALTTRAWTVAVAVRKSFGVAAESIGNALSDEIPLEEGLQRVADAFNNSAQNFSRIEQSFAELTRFVARLAERERVRAYLSAAEPTAVPEIENLRKQLSIIADNPHALLDSDSYGEASVAEFETLWSEFHERYIEHYAAVHDATVAAAASTGYQDAEEQNGNRIDDLARREDWRETEALSELSLIKAERWAEVERIFEARRREECRLNVREILRESPRCACAFRLSHAADRARFAEELEAVMQRTRAAYRRTLSLLSNHIAHALENLATTPETDSDITDQALALARAFSENNIPPHLTRPDVKLIDRAVQTTGTLPSVRHTLSADIFGLLTREELAARLEQWLEDIPEQSALVEVIRDEDAAA
jgi:hypothetical protein